MLRLLIVADRADEVAMMLTRARGAARELGPDVETVVVGSDLGPDRHWGARTGSDVRIVRVEPGVPLEDRLDVGLLLRPLPEQLIVVGRDRSCSSAEICFLSMLLELRSDLAAVTTEDSVDTSSAGIVERGGAFRPGLLVPAGGFVGDGRRSVHSRLASIGCDSISIPVDSPPRTISA